MSARIEPVPSTDHSRVFVHIGTHKTGTTSFQKWLNSNESILIKRFGLGVYHGGFPNNRELGLACANTDRLLPVRQIPQWSDSLWRDHVRDLARIQMDREFGSIIVSSEALSFLRTPEEIQRVRDLFVDRQVTILLTLRQPTEFLASWARHLARGKYEFSDNPESFAYVEPDSWLARYDDLIAAYSQVFGSDNVLTVDYEAANAEFGSVIPALMQHVVDDVSRLPDWRAYRFNTTRQFESARRLNGRILRRIKRLLTRG